MSAPALTTLTWQDYLTPEGCVDPRGAGQIGVYAIFDAEEKPCYIGYSRDIYLSLRQHLIRQPQACYGFKFLPIERPNRSQLEEIRQQWLAELGSLPPGNGADQERWEKPIDLKQTMTPQMQQEWAGLDEVSQIKYLKNLARQKEAEILDILSTRHVTEPLRFNPKLKENGLLDLQ